MQSTKRDGAVPPLRPADVTAIRAGQ